MKKRKKKTGIMIFRSHEQKQNHVTMIVQSGSEEEARQLMKSMKKAVSAENRLMHNAVSCEIYCRIRK